MAERRCGVDGYMVISINGIAQKTASDHGRVAHVQISMKDSSEQLCQAFVPINRDADFGKSLNFQIPRNYIEPGSVYGFQKPCILKIKAKIQSRGIESQSEGEFFTIFNSITAWY